MTSENERIERGAGRSLWGQIAAALRAEIRDGSLPPGAALPTEAALAARFGVNRHTVRRAIADLAEAGLVRVEQGRGSFVQEAVLDYVLGRRTRFSESLLAPAMAQTRSILHAGVEGADKPVAGPLGLRAGAPVWRIELLGVSDGRPLSVASHFFDARRFPDFAAAFEDCGSISAALAAQGVDDYLRAWTRITAALPEAEDARHLQQPRTRPVLRTEALNVDDGGRPVEYGRARFAADRVQLVVGSDS